MLKRTRLLLLGTALLVGTTAAGCGNQDLAIDDTMNPESAPPVPPTEHPAEPEACTSGSFCFDPQFGTQLQPMTLGSKTTLTTAVVVSTQLIGKTVDFSVVTSVPAADLAIEVSPKSLVIPTDVNIPISISLQVPTSSAYEGNKSIALHAAVQGGSAADSKGVIVAIDPQLIVEYSGKGGVASPHTWTIPGNDPLKIGATGQKMPTMVKLRPQGVKVRFVNKDPGASHVLHCGGPIQHQPTNQPTPPNGAYVATVQTTGLGSCYDHNLESASVSVYFQFNR